MDFAGGSLKLKNVKKKPLKKKKKSSKKLSEKADQYMAAEDDDSKKKNPSDYQMLRVSESQDEARDSTEAERQFEAIQEKRLLEKAQKERFKTHKDRVDDYNRLLGNQSEHFEMPKIGPG
ncbi:DUF1754 family, FAM32A-like protein, implicated in mRNA splicing [Schizosaccharomyces osmophilus]|uniref:DUF1754 family, FAM32A-like protein, implicated in mRNA splicing n=1 Tax=Schizosaccharomyces osmophilus TaxID=2545709 RepID=A0AAE9WDR8_9SCHI|nr:DUF1754 family, FAM32A-like protein, implicated in mRNA splicing [Schizosaccharomyces osmophilus]WBW72848.1 DUF1754 family, FAM32A-like protein, implicated in mRNA splicing [Schizosaccharomyces osmophilus]